jgi:arylsulfatase A-like enzyme/Flp pilus assembly protein TadD
MRSQYIKILTGLFSLYIGVLLAFCFTLGSDAEEKNLNILLISIDTIRPDRLGCYSEEYNQTPNIDGLARKGTLFERAMAHNPLTLPSHANILLGTTPLYHGVHENANAIVTEDFHTLTELLKEKGYTTGAFIGAFPLDSRFGLDQGFDTYDESYSTKSESSLIYSERNATEVISSALQWLNRQNNPWFSWIHIWDPHAPYLPPEPYFSQYKDDRYSGEVAYVDAELKRVFDFLESHELEEKTLIILTGDHGESLGEHGEFTHGYFAYNSTLWIPLIIKAPGLYGRRVSEYVSHVDLFPTVCDILGIEKPSFLQGISLLPLLKGQRIKKRPIYFESMDAYYNRGWAPLMGYLEDEKKFIQSPIPELYDLEKDFAETKNLIKEVDLSQYRKKLKELIKQNTSSGRPDGNQRLDREAMERLASLGYVVSSVAQKKETHGIEDDLKTLLPVQQKHSKALALYERGQAEEAIELMQEIIKERNDFDKPYIQLVRMYRSSGRLRDAFAIIEQGYKANPENYGIIFTYGMLLVREGELDKGIEVLNKGLAIFKYDPEPWTLIGIAHWRKGEYQKAIKHYEMALSLDDSDAAIYNNMGTLFLSMFMQSKKREDYSRAEDSFKKAITRDPSLASAYNGLGSAYKFTGQNDAAITLWEKTLQLDPDYDFPMYNLGLAYLEKGDKSQALSYFERYLALKKETLSPAERRKVEAYIQMCKD